MPKPAMRMTISRKDGEEITFRDYTGETVTKRNQRVGAFWPSTKGGGYNFVPETGHKFDPETYWYNVWIEDEERPARRPPPVPATARKAARSAAPVDDEKPLKF